MMTTDHSPSLTTADTSPQQTPAAAPAGLASTTTSTAAMNKRSLGWVIADVVSCLLCVSACIPAFMTVMWGLALHQIALTIAGCAGGLFCLLLVGNRIWAPAHLPASQLPLITALDRRPWVMAAGATLGVMAVLSFVLSWPGK